MEDSERDNSTPGMDMGRTGPYHDWQRLDCYTAIPKATLLEVHQETIWRLLIQAGDRILAIEADAVHFASDVTEGDCVSLLQMECTLRIISVEWDQACE